MCTALDLAILFVRICPKKTFRDANKTSIKTLFRIRNNWKQLQYLKLKDWQEREVG